MSAAAPTAIRQEQAHARLVPSLVFLGMAVAVISSLGAPLVPQIATAYHVSLSQAQWSLTITLLVGAVAIPVMGRLGDGPARRAVTIGAMALTLIGSALAALPLGFWALIAGRALQGVGAGLTPLAIATARHHLSEVRSKTTVAMLSITTAAGVGLGYPLTGLIAQSFGLHAAFWFGALMSAAALLVAVRVLPHSRHLPRRHLDATGAALLGVGIASFLLVLSEGGTWGWNSPRLLGLIVLSLLLLIGWVRHELRTAHPLVDLRLTRNRAVLAANVVIVIAGIGMYLLMSLVTRLAQTPTTTGYGFGASVAVTGLTLLPFSLATVVSSRLAHLLSRHLPVRVVLALSCTASLASMVLFGLTHSALWELFVVMAVAGLGIGCTFAVVPQLIVNAVPDHETGSAISFNQLLRCVGYSTGSALSATILQAHTPGGHALPTSGGYGAAALIGTVVWIITVLVAVILPPRAQQTTSATATQQHVTGPGPGDRPATFKPTARHAPATPPEPERNPS